MKQYHELLTDILENGEQREDRTGVGTLSVFGSQLRFNLQEGFPAITTKKLAWKACKAELIWFLEGSGNERKLAEITHGTRDSEKKTIWTQNAQAPYWQSQSQFDGDLGRVYGVQWRSWRSYSDKKVLSEDLTEPVRVASDRIEIDQVARLVHGLQQDPYGRRHILTAWNVGELDQMALPPCHVMSQYYVSDGKLSCHMYQRSVDVFLGLPFNIASYALLTHMLAQVSNLVPHELVISTGDTHIYTNHVDQVKEQLQRTEYPLPTLWLNPDVKSIDSFTMDDIQLNNYQSHDSIKAPMAV